MVRGLQGMEQEAGDSVDAAPGRRRGASPARRLLAFWPVLMAGLLAVLVGSAYQGWVLTHPRRAPVTGNPGTKAYLEYRLLPCQHHIACGRPLLVPGTHIAIAGWAIPYTPDSGYPGPSSNWSQNTVVFVADHGQSRTSTPFPLYDVTMVLNEMGYNVVLYDAEGTGRSGGGAIGFGTVEVRDLQAVIANLQSEGAPQGRIAVWGLGTGADTAILAAAENPAISAVIADSPYLTPDGFLLRAIPRWTGLPAFPFARTILWAMQTETGVRYGRYSPLAAVRRLGEGAGTPGRPLLLVSGSADTLTPPADAAGLYAASHDNNALYLPVPGAGHLQAFADSPAGSVPGLSLYMCDALDTLAAMRTGRSPGEEQRAAPCGGAGPVLSSPNLPPLPGGVGGAGVRAAAIPSPASGASKTG